MSNLQKEFLRAKLRKLPLEPPMPLHAPHGLSIFPEGPDEAVEASDELPHSPLTDDSSSASSASSTGTIRPSNFHRPLQPRKKTNFDPIPWNTHFSSSLLLPTPDGSSTFHIYITLPSTGPLFVFHHGAGSSGLSSALLATSIRSLLPTAGILSFDCRGHGETTTGDDHDLSLSTLSQDMATVLSLTASHFGWEKLPDLVLVGHSLGGAVVVDVAKRGEFRDCVIGYCVIDVVEGSAMDALQSMQTYLSTRPDGFETVEQAIEWHNRTRTLRNPLSARISVPALLHPSPPTSTSRHPWTWRTDLSSTQPFWENWFIGLSSKFLSASGGKLLILAGTDRLDKELMIGQMQGKYQLIVVPEAGHFVHEDVPEKTAAVLVEFYKRNDRSALVLPPKMTAVKKA
ncbi:protein phosphatase methylesterase [Ascodesmis nigricans]|uniref:Protein phosphatase methylesterase 1 n=1 Tax=Ascodesmis nigricans TaxID=341454 RepID=A0A4S2MYX2_9PEZI|nr:protein phosphatase methylesterase [Ascodesmis nigricans]